MGQKKAHELVTHERRNRFLRLAFDQGDQGFLEPNQARRIAAKTLGIKGKGKKGKKSDHKINTFLRVIEDQGCVQYTSTGYWVIQAA